MTTDDETHDDAPEPAELPTELNFHDAVLRLVTAENLPAVYDAYTLAEQVAQLIRDGLTETGFPVERVRFIAPSVGDDGRPVVWVHLGDVGDLRGGLFATGGAGPPPAA